MVNLEQAIDDWSRVIGREAVIIEKEAIIAAQTATFATTQRVPVIVRPANRIQVQKILKIANRHRVPIYAVSKGKNWGLGSRVPVKDNCVLMALDRLNRIVEYDEKLAYITVEPGVTFRQAAEFLQAQESSLFLSVIGGHPDSSLIGNALERGDGIGPYGDRLAHSCSMEIVLPDGEVIHPGFGRYKASKVSKINRWGVGPHMDGLFSQSNLGIVTQMTFWLMARPKNFQSFLFTIRDLNHLQSALGTLRGLQAQGVIRGNSLAIWNVHKMVASERQFPWSLTCDTTPLPLDELKGLKSPWGKCEWIGVGALYSASPEHGRADRRIIRKSLRRHVERILFLDGRKVRLINSFERPLSWITGTNIGDVTRSLYSESVFLGFPTERSTRSTYWRKRSPIPENMNPDRDGCGVIWLCPILPFNSAHLTKAIGIVGEKAYGHGFEPQIAFICPSERAIYMFPSIVYDRMVPGEDERAMLCHDSMLQRMMEEGYFPYRLGIQSMASLPVGWDSHDKLVRRIKGLLDPHHILAPGRYAFGENAGVAREKALLKVVGRYEHPR